MVSTTEVLSYKNPATAGSYPLPRGGRKELRKLNETCFQFYRVSICQDSSFLELIVDTLANFQFFINIISKIIGDKSIIGDYSRVRIFLDENFESLEKFTALGSLYLIRDSVKNIQLYNFKTAQYESIKG